MEQVISFRESPTLEAASEIVKKFIGGKSRTPVNVPGSTIDKIQQQIKQGNFSADIFDVATTEVLNLLRNDTYRRFLKQRENFQAVTMEVQSSSL